MPVWWNEHRWFCFHSQFNSFWWLPRKIAQYSGYSGSLLGWRGIFSRNTENVHTDHLHLILPWTYFDIPIFALSPPRKLRSATWHGIWCLWKNDTLCQEPDVLQFGEIRDISWRGRQSDRSCWPERHYYYLFQEQEMGIIIDTSLKSQSQTNNFFVP